MPKAKNKASIKKERRRIFKKSDQELFMTDKFVYLVEHYRCTSHTFNLEDSKFMETKEFTKDSTEHVTQDSITTKKRATLVGAPLPWLIENKFTELCPD